MIGDVVFSVVMGLAVGIAAYLTVKQLRSIKDDKPPLEFLRVKDDEINRSNSYWHGWIGSCVMVLAHEPDGHLTVAVPGSAVPIEGVKAERFEPMQVPE